ncbi:MAG TPA: cytochrome c peroxidase [Flavipsychrobacter sp.]|nr:cytochrome c peroxidase [Flavipsychrobacter sp.]
MKKSILYPGLAAILFSFACNKNEKGMKDNNLQAEVYLDLSDTTGNYFDGFYPEEVDKKAVLGRVLFYDKQLSVNNAIACASCHKQEFAFSDNVAFSRGFEGRLTGRNSMAIQNFGNGAPGNMFNRFNSGFLFWDGRETDLVNLVSRPILNHVEMGISDVDVLPAKLANVGYYQGLFKDAYGDDEITMDRIAEAMALFMNAIVSSETHFDKCMDQKEEFTAMELMGLQLFHKKYNCASCHTVEEGSYHSSLFANIGLDAQTKDAGAGVIGVAEFPQGSFKAPNLRNVALTAPYMHDGRFNTLNDVIDHYSQGIQNHPELDVRLRDGNGGPMRMNIKDEEKQAIVAFLNTLTDYTMITEPKYSNPFKTR